MREVDIPIQRSVEGQEVDQSFPSEPQILLVLVGLPGSGKTTFAGALLRNNGGANSGRRTWIRASQDDAPSRRRQECEAITRNGLKQGCNVIVDRVGFDAVQRSHFINIADQQHSRPLVYALYLSVSIPILEERLSLRTSHPTLADPKTAMIVLRDMNRQLSIPTPISGEGFDKIYTLEESFQPLDGGWTQEDLDRVLGLIASEGKGETVPRRLIEPRPFMTNGWRGRGDGHCRPMNGRGRGDYQGYPRGGYNGGQGRGNHGGFHGPPASDRAWRPYPQPGQQQYAGYRAERPPYRPQYDNSGKAPYSTPTNNSPTAEQDNRS